MKWIFLSCMILSCSNQVALKNSINRIDIYQQAGSEQYLLPLIPDWSNSSVIGQCKRQFPVQLMNLAKLKKSFNYTYQQALHFQKKYNQLRRLQKNENESTFLTPEDKENIFFQVKEQIKTDKFLSLPNFKRYNIYWIDPLLKSKKGKRQFQALMSRPDFNNGVPIILSQCLLDHEIEKILRDWNIKEEKFYYISYELFNPYPADDDQIGFEQLNLSQIFPSESKIFFYKPKNYNSPNIYGLLSIQSY